MVVIFVVIVIILGFIIYGLIIFDDKLIRYCLIMLYSIFVILFVGLVINYSQREVPTALDVYREKTDLQINKTFKNDSILIKCDSVVVFKN